MLLLSHLRVGSKLHEHAFEQRHEPRVIHAFSIIANSDYPKSCYRLVTPFIQCSIWVAFRLQCIRRAQMSVWSDAQPTAPSPPPPYSPGSNHGVPKEHSTPRLPTQAVVVGSSENHTIPVLLNLGPQCVIHFLISVALLESASKGAGSRELLDNTVQLDHFQALRQLPRNVVILSAVENVNRTVMYKETCTYFLEYCKSDKKFLSTDSEATHTVTWKFLR